MKENLRVETFNQVEHAEDIEKLVHDIKELETRNDEKAESLEKVLIEKDMLLERLQLLEERNKELLVNVQKENLSLAKELSLECTFKCTFCEDKFVTGNEVKVHERRNHENQFKSHSLSELCKWVPPLLISTSSVTCL